MAPAPRSSSSARRFGGGPAAGKDDYEWKVDKMLNYLQRRTAELSAAAAAAEAKSGPAGGAAQHADLPRVGAEGADRGDARLKAAQADAARKEEL